MPVLIQICAVIVTMAIAAIAIVTIRAMKRFEKAADTLSETAEAVRRSMGQLQDITSEVRELVTSLGSVVPEVRRTLSKFAELGDRTAQLSTAVFEEVAAPVRTAVAVARGVRSGTSLLLERLTHKFARRRSPHPNGEYDHAQP